MGTKFPAFGRLDAPQTGIKQAIEVHSAQLRRSRFGETRPRTLASIRGQRELRHQQEFQPLIEQTPVHAVISIGEHPIGEYALSHAFNIPLGIVRLDGHQDEQPATDFGDALAIDRYAGFSYPLNETNHEPFPM
jgi:hypothetical protein